MNSSDNTARVSFMCDRELLARFDQLPGNRSVLLREAMALLLQQPSKATAEVLNNRISVLQARVNVLSQRVAVLEGSG